MASELSHAHAAVSSTSAAVAASTSRQQRRDRGIPRKFEERSRRRGRVSLTSLSFPVNEVARDHDDGEYLDEIALDGAALANAVTRIVPSTFENSGPGLNSESSRRTVDLFVLITARGEVATQLSESARLGTYRAE